MAPLVGRAAERGTALAELARASAGRAQLLLITGEAGIGKTRLTEELCAVARDRDGGAQVRIGEAVPLVGATLAYGPFVAALPDRAEWLFSEDTTGDPARRAAPPVRAGPRAAGRAFRGGTALTGPGGHALGR